MKSVFDIKQTAGNIIPAIATTNAIVAGLSALVSLRVLSLLNYAKISKPTELNMVFTAKASNISQNRYLTNPTLAPPNCNCPVCSRVVRGVMKIPRNLFGELKLKDLVSILAEKYSFDSEELSVLDTTGHRLLSDFDFDSLDEKTLEEIKIIPGTLLLITDETENDDGTCLKPLELYIDEIASDDGKMSDISLPDMKIPLTKITSTTEEDNKPVEDVVPQNNGEKIVLDLEDEDDEKVKKRKFAGADGDDALSKKSKSDNEIEIIEEDDIIALD